MLRLCSVNAADKGGWTPLHFAARNGHSATAEALMAAGAG
jgi:ankyrin repeat protein